MVSRGDFQLILPVLLAVLFPFMKHEHICTEYTLNVVYRWKSYLEHLGGAGANSIRVWVHVEGDVSPQYDGNG
jgi:hypothetical protein